MKKRIKRTYQSIFLIENEKSGKKSPNEDAVIKYLLEKYDFKTIFTKCGEEMFCSDGNLYSSSTARQIIKTECQKALKVYCKNKNVLEITEGIKRSTAIGRDYFDNIPLILIPLNNGIYNLKSKKLIGYDKKFPFRFCFPIDYIAQAECPKFMQFITETLLPEDIPCIQEWFGFCLYRQYFVKKGMIWLGEKNTGKTLLINILVRLLGEKNISTLSLQRIVAEDKFALASLYTKHANIYDDLSSKDLSSGAGFKIVTGGGWVSAEYKFGDNFQFQNFAKLLFACNKIPPIKDEEDGAYLSRWLPIEFCNQVPEDEIDNFLLDKLTTPQELSGILNWALEGLQRLLKNGKFSYIKTEDEIKRIMQSGNSLTKFGDDCLIEKKGNQITKEGMYEIYTEWAKKSNSSRFSKEQLGRNLSRAVKYILAKNDTRRYWDNVALNESSKFLQGNLDTLDTFKKIIRVEKEDSKNSIDIIKKEVSNPSNLPLQIQAQLNPDLETT